MQNNRKRTPLITREKVDAYIQKIPPTPQALQQTIIYLNQGELIKAARTAQKDLALSAYLVELVNKPIFGFRDKVEDISQIFGILGVARSQQALYNYMISLLSPAKWHFFRLNKSSFYDIQAELSIKWQIILKHLNITDKEIQNTITLLPATIIVCEALFCEKLDDVKLLRSVDEIDLNTILIRLCNLDLFDICQIIATKWNMSEKSMQIIQASSGLKPAKNDEINTLGKWMHLLLFFTLSRAEYINAGLNDFINFKIEYVEEIYDDFAKLMEIA